MLLDGALSPPRTAAPTAAAAAAAAAALVLAVAAAAVRLSASTAAAAAPADSAALALAAPAAAAAADRMSERTPVRRRLPELLRLQRRNPRPSLQLLGVLHV